MPFQKQVVAADVAGGERLEQHLVAAGEGGAHGGPHHPPRLAPGDDDADRRQHPHRVLHRPARALSAPPRW